MECIAAATSSSVERLFAMTFHGLPSRYRNLLRWKAGEICPACSQGMQRPPRLKAWSFAFSFWCERHRQPLFSRDTRGVSALGDYWAARRGGAILNRWGMGKGADGVPVEPALSLLLSPIRKAAPPAPWELARLSLPQQHEPSLQSKRFRRPALTIVVPEFVVAVPIYDQQLPPDIAQLSSAPFAERYALAIGVARLLNDPADMIARIDKAADEHCRKKIKRNCATVGSLAIGQRKERPDRSKDKRAKFFDPHSWP